MLISILQSYLTLLLSIAAGSLFIFMTGIYLIFRTPRKSRSAEKNQSITDFSAIAGDDVITTQLDLARAYIETDKKSLAVTLLKDIIKQGNPDQRLEAKQLMKSI